MLNYNGSEGESISLEEAASYTANYRNQQSQDTGTVRAHFFGREILQKILDQEGCVGIRMYYGLDDAGNKQLVLIGANADGEDQEEGTVADRSKVCPPDCVVGHLNG
ncbi:hypothetical protein MKJ04_06675 [Pontibacter sp. E15-1]|uniref:hypothetical protein n=1 Tax=Pontibacter sp. E15-1 TaxID=2919918 RepID=UPI001F4FB2A4|nr:hypothetical protein [Pontibacter sp. E15-1]MCJ8164525.1 hypothetical protein [Pontibacter sp. E15-1]